MNQADIEQMDYNTAMGLLEDLVRKMQSPECDIDRLSDYTEQSLLLLRHCKAKLTATDEKVKKILQELESSNAE